MKEKANRQIPLGASHSKVIRLLRSQEMREAYLQAFQECLCLANAPASRRDRLQNIYGHYG